VGGRKIQKGAASVTEVYPRSLSEHDKKARSKRLREGIKNSEQKIAELDEYLTMLGRIKNGTQTSEDMMKCYQYYTHNL
jgi:hypothetical protein